MAIQTGSRLGPYEILAPLGAGGMGEVYRAKDTRLDRTVAIKVLPSHLSSTPEARQRFEREARAVSSLNHPHICTLHDVGNQDGVEYLVMEFLEGETLSDRLRKGPLPSDQVLRYAIEIADALDKAHKSGIVHRDLKPGNIMLSKSGAKLLDFGLAKLQTAASQNVLSGVSTMNTEANKNLTAEGSIVGTFQYMAPEQLEGKDLDSRTDIFAFGVVLYEMLTGQKAFAGTSQASLIAAILEKQPQPISEIQPMTPPALDRVVRICLSKDPDERWQSAHDLMNELKWIREGSSQTGTPVPVSARRKHRERLSWSLAAIFFLASIALALLYFRHTDPKAPQMQFSILPPQGTTTQLSVISPDGNHLAMVATDGTGKTGLWVRSLDSLTPRALPETDGAADPFWSPDSGSLGFFTSDKLKKIDISGGRAQTLCDVQEPRGGSWSSKGMILFSSNALLHWISSSGGPVTQILKIEPGEEANRWPCFLPDGNHFLFLGDAFRTEQHHLRSGSLDSTKSRILLSSFISDVAYTRAGFILFVRQGELMAQTFDPERLQISGEAFPLAEYVAEIGPHHQFDFSVSDQGTLAYRTLNPNSQLTWFDRSGKRLGTAGEPGRLVYLDLSPDENHVAVEQLDADGRNGDIWILDLFRKTKIRFTFDPNWDSYPNWSPDGSRIVFASARDVHGPAENLYWKNSDGGGSEELLLKSEAYLDPTSWSPDGETVAFNRSQVGANNLDIWFLNLGDRRPTPFLQTAFNEYDAQFSPDGKWIAYVSDESGKWEVYIQPVSASGGKWQVSTNGGIQPKWRKDGEELFFISGEKKLSAAEIQFSSTLKPGIPQTLFPVRVVYFAEHHDYAVSTDGQRFLVNTLPEDATFGSTNLVFNWASELKR